MTHPAAPSVPVVRRLANGATLVAERIEGVKSAAVSWLVPGGSADDPAEMEGLSAMWAELLMRGAGPLSSREQADAFDRLGCARSADTGTLFMRLGATALGSRLHDALPLLVDMVLRPRFDEDAIEPARDLALQAIESLKDDPQERASLAARRRHFPVPINRSGLGTRAGLAAVTREGAVAGWRAVARPARSIFAVAGAIDADSLATTLDSLLASWTGASPEPSIGASAPRGYDHETHESNQVQIIVIHDAPTERSDESLLEKIVVSVLSGGMSGRLFSEVREKRGLCYSVHAGYRGDRDFGSVTAYVGTTPERAQESLDVLLAELARIGTPPGAVTEEEFRRAVTGMKSRLVFSGESTGARAAALASDMHRLGRARTLAELAAAIDAVTLDQVNAYVSKRRLGRMTIQTLGPKPLNPPAA